jgi:hypothetical protein
MDASVLAREPLNIDIRPPVASSEQIRGGMAASGVGSWSRAMTFNADEGAKRSTHLGTGWTLAICLAGVAVALFQLWIATNLIYDYLVANSGSNSDTSGRTPGSLGLSYENVDYDGHLPAWYVDGQAGHPVIVMVGGYGGGRTSLLEKMVPLHRLGYGLLAIEMSYQLGWQSFGGGQREAAQVVAADHWVTIHTRQKVVLYGDSVGGLSVLLAGAEGLRPTAIVSDSGIVSMRNQVAHAIHMPAALLGPFEMFYPWFSGGGHILDVGTELQRHPGYQVPTLIIQGTADHAIYWTNGPTLARLTHGNLWLLPGVEHLRAFQANPASYIARVNAFIKASEAREDAPG